MIMFNKNFAHICWAGGVSVGWLTTVKTKKLRVLLIAGALMEFFIDLIFPAALRFLGWTQPLKRKRNANISLW